MVDKNAMQLNEMTTWTYTKWSSAYLNFEDVLYDYSILLAAFVIAFVHQIYAVVAALTIVISFPLLFTKFVVLLPLKSISLTVAPAFISIVGG